jgi:hypothetical protein
MENTGIQEQVRQHLVYRCENVGTQRYTARVIKVGCGRYQPFSTTRKEGSKTRPWIAKCPECGKKSRMRHREVLRFETRAEAEAAAAKKNRRKGHGGGVIQ